MITRCLFKIAVILLVAFSVALILSCSQAYETSSEQTPTESENNAPPEEVPLIKGPVSEDGIQAIFATPDIGAGRHRIAFALVSQTGLVNALSATVQSFYNPQPDSLGEPAQTALALFHPFPLVERGLYVTNLTSISRANGLSRQPYLATTDFPKRPRCSSRCLTGLTRPPSEILPSAVSVRQLRVSRDSRNSPQARSRMKTCTGFRLSKR